MLLDTNALFLPVRGGFPLDAEIERVMPGARVLVPDSARRELERLAERATPRAMAARALAARYPGVSTPGAGDDAIVAAALRLRSTVVTADRDLQVRLRELGVDVLTPRDRHRLELRRGAATASRPGGTRRTPRRRPARGNG